MPEDDKQTDKTKQDGDVPDKKPEETKTLSIV